MARNTVRVQNHAIKTPTSTKVRKCPKLTAVEEAPQQKPSKKDNLRGSLNTRPMIEAEKGPHPLRKTVSVAGIFKKKSSDNHGVKYYGEHKPLRSHRLSTLSSRRGPSLHDDFKGSFPSPYYSNSVNSL
jgi:hypothetical protein